MAEEGFSETTDGVKAKLQVEVPEQALTTLAGLAKQTEAYRISMEAAARATGDHLGYLEKMPTIADVATKKLQEWCDQVEHAIDLKGKLDTGMGTPGAVGQDSSSPFGNATLGRGDLVNLLAPMASSDPSRVVSMGAARGMTPEGAGAFSDEQMRQLAQVLSGGGGSGGGGKNDGGSGKGPRQPGRRSEDEQTPENDQGWSHKALEEGALKSRDLAGRILNETGPGTSMGDAIGVGREAIDMMGGAGGMLGKVGGALGPIGAGVGLALTANQLLQMGGQQYQEYKNLGMQSGGGAKEGMAYDMQAKMLALDPFISTAQAREVIQGALSEGYGGDTFDTVTDFLAKNLKDMNLSVSESLSMLKTNVDEGGMSIEQLGMQLANVSAMAKGSAMGQSELTDAFGSGTAALSGLGIQNQGQIATEFLGQFSGSPLLSSVGSSVMEGALANPNFATWLAQGTGLTGTPSMILRKLGDKLPQQTLAKLTDLAKQAKQQGNDPEFHLEWFHRRLGAYGLNISPNEARELMNQLAAPGGMEAAARSGQSALSAAAQPVDQGGFVSQSMASLGTVADHTQNILGTVGGVAKDIFTLNWGNIDDRVAASDKRKGEIDRGQEAKSSLYTTESLKRATELYGTENLQVFDPGTGKSSALDANNKAQRDALVNEQLQIQRKGQSPQTLKDFGVNNQAEQSSNVKVSADPITVRYEGPISGPSSVPMTANDMQAKSGFGGATVNNAPPGDR